MLTPISYPATIREAEPREFLVTFVDLPEALTSGSTLDEAQAEATDALAVAIEGYLEAGRPVPAWRAAGPGEIDVPLDPAIAARVLLVDEMTRQRLSKVDVAQRMGKDEKVVRRIISGKGATFGQTLQALRALGRRAALAA